jgi:streptogramin lyase
MARHTVFRNLIATAVSAACLSSCAGGLPAATNGSLVPARPIVGQADNLGTDAGPSFVEIGGVNANSNIAPDAAGSEWFYDALHTPPSIDKVAEQTHQASFYEIKDSVTWFALAADKQSMWYTGHDQNNHPIIGSFSLASPQVRRVVRLQRPAYHLTAGPLQSIWFSTTGNSIGRFDPKTHIVYRYDTGKNCGFTNNIVVGSDDAVWFDGFGNYKYRLCRFDPATHAFSSYDLKGGLPAGITTGPNGTLWFTMHASAYQLGEFEIATHAIAYFDVPDGRGSDMGGIVLRHGDLWFTYSGGNIGRFNPKNDILTLYSTPNPHQDYPLEIARGADDQLWITEGSSLDRILLMCPSLGKTKCKKT